jgi:hypothetical protein
VTTPFVLSKINRDPDYPDVTVFDPIDFIELPANQDSLEEAAAYLVNYCGMGYKLFFCDSEEVLLLVPPTGEILALTMDDYEEPI